MRSFLFLLASLLVACASVSRPSQSKLIGNWRYADATQSCRYAFLANGTFRADVALHGKTVAKFTGRWSVKGDNLLYEYLTDQRGKVAPGTTDHDKLLAVESSFFLIEAADGSHRRYVREPASAERSATNGEQILLHN